jgi:hypothetical protein
MARRRRHDRKPQNRLSEMQFRVWGSRVCLVFGVVAYLGLVAALSVLWRPHEPLIASIWIFLLRLAEIT